MAQWITEEKIVLLEYDMNRVIDQLHEAARLSPNSADYQCEIEGVQAKIRGLHTTLTSWEMLIEALLRERSK